MIIKKISGSLLYYTLGFCCSVFSQACSGSYSSIREDQTAGAARSNSNDNSDPATTQASLQRHPDSESLNLTQALAKANLKTQTIRIESDAVYVNQTKTYVAYRLMDVMSLFPKFKEASLENRRSSWGVTFEAMDRFKVTFPLTKLYEKEAFLAHKEAARPDGKDWALIPAKKEAMTPAPYYLVWKDLAPTLDFPNPYQIAFIVLEPLSVTYKEAFPADQKEVNGFSVFSSRCIWCHSINYVGGRSAIEFNVPESITLNRSAKDLPAMMGGQGKTGKPCKLRPETNQSISSSLWSYLLERSKYPICTTAEDCQKKEPL